MLVMYNESYWGISGVKRNPTGLAGLGVGVGVEG